MMRLVKMTAALIMARLSNMKTAMRMKFLENEIIPVNDGTGGELGEVPGQKIEVVIDSGDAAMMDQTKMTESNNNVDARNASSDQFVATNNVVERIVTIEELEEEVGMHETTLESLNSKLQKLNEEIQKGENNSSSLRSDIQLLNQRKKIFRKRTDNNLKLVKDLEMSLEKCLERLRRALDALGGDGSNQHHGGNVVVVVEVDSGINDADGAIQLLGQEQAHHETHVAPFEGGLVGNDIVVSVAVDLGKNKAGGGTQVIDLENILPKPQTTSEAGLKEKYIYNEVPLHAEYEIRGQISWPTPKIVSKIQREVETLPCDFPTWRTHPLSMPLLGGIDSAHLIADMMNVAVLERLLEREERQSGGELSNDFGWVKEADIWGTSLDVCAHVNWKHLFSGFRRVDESKGVQSTTADIDPNVIVCPYELGGTCADDQCPYQHLKKGDGRDKTKLISLDDGSYEGYVRYNNIPKPKLPRSFLRDDFIITRGVDSQKVGDALHQLTSSSSDRPNEGEDKEEPASNNFYGVDNSQDHQTDNRLYHCPICVGQKTFNQEELQAHMNQCNPSSIVVNNRSLTIRHVLQNPGEDDDQESRNSAIRDSSSESEDDSMNSKKVDGGPTEQLIYPDDSMASQGSEGSVGSVGSVGSGHLISKTEDHPMSADNADDGPVEQLPDSRVPSCVEENLDYISLPSVLAPSIDGDSNHGSYDDNYALGDEKTIFDDVFWWHQIDSLPSAPSDIIEGCQNSFDSLLLAFGFQRLCINGEEGRSHSLRYMMGPPSDIGVSTQEQIENILLFSRLIDLCRLLVHMGRDSFALSAIHSICHSKTNSPYSPLFEGVSWSIKNLSHSRCAFRLFQVQAHLLLVSESLHAHYDSLFGKNSVGDGLCLNTLLDQIAHLNRTEMFAEKNLLPAGFDTLSQSLMARLLSTTDSKDGHDEWAAFAKTLRLMMEKFVVIPFSQLETNQQILLLLQSIGIGKFLGHLVREASKKDKFASYLHALEPIWSSLQPLLQASSGCKGWLEADIIAIVVIGPVIFGCVTDTVAPPGEAATLQKLPPKFDARALANVSSLDIFIVGIIKELNRFGRRSNDRFIEPLLAPLYAISATICVALGSFEKAHLRLEQVLNKEVVSSVKKHPSIYALSEMIWSQLVQIRMICPSYYIPLKRTGIVDGMPSKLSVPDEIIGTHHEIASRIVENGIFLWGVQLRGDSHMNIISPCFNQTHCKEWEKVATLIFIDHPLIETNGREVEETLSSVEFCISDPYPELDGVKGRASVFPESPLLLGKALTHLSLEKCRLTSLPLSIGHHLANLKLLNLSNNLLYKLPASISHMARLEVLNISYNKLKTLPKLSHCSNLRVIDVSHNQLTNFPADLALQCQNLQTFLVDGNPASDILPPPQKRQKVGKIADDS